MRKPLVLLACLLASACGGIAPRESPLDRG